MFVDEKGPQKQLCQKYQKYSKSIQKINKQETNKYSIL
jgi:hypothetical protein